MDEQVDYTKETAKNEAVSEEYERKIKEYHDKRVVFYDS